MGCGASTEAVIEAGERRLRRKPNWKLIQAKLVTGKSDTEKAMRAAQFLQFDPNGNGYLSLAEVDKGLRDVLALDDIFDCKPVIMRAFQAAKGLNTKAGKPSRGDDYIEKNEFRMLLVYLSEYMKIWEAFSIADDTDDKRLNKNEFSTMYKTLGRWAPNMTVDQCWDACCPKGAQNLVFTDFAEWACPLSLAAIVEDVDQE